MTSQWILIFCIITPMLGACFLPLIGRVNLSFRNIFALLLVLASFAGAGIALPYVLQGEPLLLQAELPLGLSFGLYGDGLAIFMALLTTLVSAIIIFYSFGYMEHEENQNEYYFLMVMFIGAMQGLIYSTNLIYLYVFWEITAICCWRLIGFYRRDIDIIRADKAFLITVGGALLMLSGFIAIYVQTGTFDLMQLKGSGVDFWIVLLILCGILSKSAILPFHSWLPDAGVAPSPVTALLHAAVLVKIGVYVFARLFLLTFQLEAVWTVAIPAIAAISALVAAGAAIVENDIKRILAYSTISQLSFILMGLSTGTMVGAFGGLLYILMHSLAKGGLFLCAGIIEHSTHTKDIREMSGLAKRLPITTVSFLFCMFSVMGVPPFGGFFSKYLVLSGSFQSHQILITVTFFLGSIMTIVYLVRLFSKVFLGPCSHPDIREGSWEMVISVLFLGIAGLIAGIFINLPANFLNLIIDSVGRW